MVEALETGRVGGAYHGGRWIDVGTPAPLAALDAALLAARALAEEADLHAHHGER